MLSGISLGRTGYVSSRIQFHLNPLGINFSSHGQMKLLKHRSIFYHFHILSKLFRGLDDELHVIEKNSIYENNQIHLLTKHANIKFVLQDRLKTSIPIILCVKSVLGYAKKLQICFSGTYNRSILLSGKQL